MNFLNDMNMGKKMTLFTLIAVLAIGVVGALGYFDLKEANHNQDIMYSELFIPKDLIAAAVADVNAVKAYTLELMLTADVKRNQELKLSIESATQRVSTELAALEKIPMDAKAKEMLMQIKAMQQSYRSARTEVIELAMQNKNAEAYAAYGTKLDAHTNNYIKALNALSDYFSQRCKQIDDEVDAAARQTAMVLIGAILTMVIVLGVAGLVISRGITKPLQQMVAFCHELARGNFIETERKVRRKDEIGQLADALADMRTKVRLVLKQVAESAELVGSSSEELTASSEQSSQAAGQVAESIASVASGANQQLIAVGETSAVVEQMSAGIQQVAANANTVAAKSAQAAGKAMVGGQTVERAVGQMHAIASSAQIVADAVAKLNNKSQEIGQIVDTISGIAGQTNLLALNAAIEAARAGEQGRGFAVVAEEVRKLAEDSQNAAKKISEIIGEIQSDTQKAVDSMGDGARDVQTGTEVVNEAGVAFKEIADMVTQVSDQVKEISAAIQQMATGSQQIVSSVKQIDALSKASSSESQSVSAATEEQLASMEEIAGASEALAKLAQELQEAVAKFRV
jgi:methyl-accepting chemotaxis protein